MSPAWTTFWVQMIASAVTGGFTLWGAYEAVSRTADNAKREKRDQLREDMAATLQALKTEISTLLGRHMDSVGTQLAASPPGTPFLHLYPVFSEYFGIYRANTAFIGRIHDEELRSSIVRTYTMMIGFVDSFQMNNEMVRYAMEAETQHATIKSPASEQILQNRMSLLSNYGDSLRTYQGKLLTEVGTLMDLFRARGIS